MFPHLALDPTDPVNSAIGVLAVVAACLLTFYALRRTLASHKIRRTLSNVPQAPGIAWPFLGHALQLAGSSPWNKMMTWCHERGGGNLVYFKVLDKHVLYVSNPLLLRRVLQTQQRIYRKDLPSYTHFRCLLGQGLVTSEDEAWRHGRLLLSQAMRIDVLDTIPAVGVRAAARLIHEMVEAKGKAVDLDEAYRHLTLEVIGEAVLSLPAEEAIKVLPGLYLPVVQEANARIWAPWRQYMPWLAGSRARVTCLQKLNVYLEKYVRRRWQTIHTEKKQQGDILDRYMTQLKECTEAEVRQVRDDLKTMILAGHETSAATLTWATYELLTHPDIAREVVAESERVFGDCDIEKGEAPSAEAIKSLKWAPAVLRETLRLHNVVPLTMRVAAKDDEIPAAETGLGHAITVPKGCTIMVGIAGVHTRADLWPEPMEFRPDRFFGYPDSVDPFAWIPFINGPRNCLGQHLSFLEMQIVLSLMFGRLNLTLRQDPLEAGRAHPSTIPVIPAKGLHVAGTMRS
jgi:cytochrome P450